MLRLRIKEIAEAKNISMTRLSRLADVNYKTIQAIYKNPYHDIAYSTLLKIAKALQCEISDIIEEVDA